MLVFEVMGMTARSGQACMGEITLGWIGGVGTGGTTLAILTVTILGAHWDMRWKRMC